MKTDRLTLLIAPAEKAAITTRADELGLSVSELVRRATASYDPDEREARAEVEALLPELSAAIRRMDSTLDRMLVRAEEHERRMAWLRSDEYRAEVAQGLRSDPKIDWNWIEKVRAGALHRSAEAA